MDFGRLEGATWEELDPETRSGLKTLDGFISPGGESAAGRRRSCLRVPR